MKSLVINGYNPKIQSIELKEWNFVERLFILYVEQLDYVHIMDICEVIPQMSSSLRELVITLNSPGDEKEYESIKLMMKFLFAQVAFINSLRSLVLEFPRGGIQYIFEDSFIISQLESLTLKCDYYTKYEMDLLARVIFKSYSIETLTFSPFCSEDSQLVTFEALGNLPEALQNLPNLHTLNMKYCKYNDVEDIRRLGIGLQNSSIRTLYIHLNTAPHRFDYMVLLDFFKCLCDAPYLSTMYNGFQSMNIHVTQVLHKLITYKLDSFSCSMIYSASCHFAEIFKSCCASKSLSSFNIHAPFTPFKLDDKSADHFLQFCRRPDNQVEKWKVGNIIIDKTNKHILLDIQDEINIKIRRHEMDAPSSDPVKSSHKNKIRVSIES